MSGDVSVIATEPDWEGAVSPLVVRGQGCCRTPYKHTGQSKNCPAPRAHSAKAEKPWCM